MMVKVCNFEQIESRSWSYERPSFDYWGLFDNAIMQEITKLSIMESFSQLDHQKIQKVCMLGGIIQ